MKRLTKILLFLWQLPQNLVALLLMLIYRCTLGKPELRDYKGVKYVWYDKWRNGVSLGCYVLMGTWYEDDLETINHEYGHTRQSVIFGPLYLLLIGLPSIVWNIIDRILVRKLKVWTYNKSYRIYYSMPWEHGADVLGGVKRHYEE